MRKLLYICIILLTYAHTRAQDPVSYVGRVGNHNVEMELTTKDNKAYTGRYRFEGRQEWLLLSGELYYDRRQLNPQNLILKEYVTMNTPNPLTPAQSSGEFTLYVSGDSLTGYWNKQAGAGAPGIPVVLRKGKPAPNNAFDGFYYVADNELKVKTISENTIEVSIWIASTSSCKGIKLSGTMLRVGNEWKGSLQDENDNGEAGVVLSFAGENAHLQINPALLAGAKCNLSATPYVRQLVKEKGVLR